MAGGIELSMSNIMQLMSALTPILISFPEVPKPSFTILVPNKEPGFTEMMTGSKLESFAR